MEIQNYRLKLFILIILFIGFAPFGLLYFWLNRQILYKKIFIPLLLSGIWGVFISFTILIKVLPEFTEISEVPSFLTIFLYIIFIFYLCQIILGFIINKKINSLPELSKKHFNIAMIILITGSIIIPISLISIIANSIFLPMYQFIGTPI